MAPEEAPNAVKEALEASKRARRLSDEHQRANRDVDPGDQAVVRRGEKLKRLAAEASANFEFAKQQARVAAAAKRRQDTVTRDGELQARLRAESQARRDAAASPQSPKR
ncbi:MAG TPA: hypothetical protein VGG41_01270 [Solirubrobacteraceae bacterium]|jgi:hypothetical protein